MNATYELFSDLEGTVAREVVLALAEIPGEIMHMRRRMLEDGTGNAYVRMEGGEVRGAIFFHDYLKFLNADGGNREVVTTRTVVPDGFRREGRALDMRRKFNNWAQDQGYDSVRTEGLNPEMRALFEKLAGLDQKNHYDFSGEHSPRVSISLSTKGDTGPIGGKINCFLVTGYI
jgi:predicted GNAT family acetyltransferase